MKKFVILVFIFISITALMFAANNCVEFNASGPRDNSQRISVPTTGISASSGSVSLWFNYNSRSATERYRFFGHVQPRDEWKNRIFIGDDPAGGGEFEHDFYIGLGDTWDLDTNIFIPEIGTWYHAVLTWDNGDYVFYLDGGQESLGTYDSLITIADSADIGNSGKVDDQIYAPNAKIDNMRIYNRALTSTEVSDLYTSEISGPTNGLVAHWKFDTGSGTTAYDDTSNDNDGTLINGVSWATSLAPLPVTLSSFTAYYSENGPVLHWITQSEDDNIGWNIYRNDENELNNAVKVNTDLIDGQGTTAEPSYYNYSDNSEELTIGTTYYYWLESLDLSGQTHVYDNSLVTITIPDPTNQPPNYEKPVVYSLNAAPNPMLDQTDFHFTLDRDAMVNISIYNLKGKLIKKLPAIAANSDEKMTVYWNGKDSNNKRLYSGIYLYKLGVNGKTIKTNKLLIIR